MAGFIMQGQVLRNDHVVGQSERGPFDYNRLRVLVEDDVFDVKVERDYEGPVPNKGDQWSAEVALRPYKDSNSGRAALSIKALRPTARPAAVRPAAAS